MCSSELFRLATASASASAWNACSEPSLACRILSNMRALLQLLSLLRYAARLRRLWLSLRPRRRQQVAGQIEGVGDDRRNDRARNDGGHQRRVLALIDDPTREPEQGRDRTKCKAGRHQERRIHRLLVRCLVDLGNGVYPDDLAEDFEHEHEKESGGSGQEARPRHGKSGPGEVRSV